MPILEAESLIRLLVRNQMVLRIRLSSGRIGYVCFSGMNTIAVFVSLHAERKGADARAGDTSGARGPDMDAGMFVTEALLHTLEMVVLKPFFPNRRRSIT